MKKQEKKTGLEEFLKGGQETLPGFRFQIYRAEEKRSLWNADFELLFLLKGDGRVSYEDGVVYQIREKDLFVVNGFQICSIDLNEQGILLSLKMSADAIASVHIEFLKYEIECRSFLFTEEQQEVFDIIRSDLARVFQEAYKNDMMQPVNARSRITALLEDLSRYFAAGERVKHSRSGRERIQMASDYMLQHYKEAVTLEDLADHLYLSRAYISRSFPRYFGVSFLEYVTQVRLAHAVQEMHSGATLTEISYRNGFVNETAMIRAFRKYRGMTPSEYRKQMKHTAEQSEKKGKEREETAEDHDIFQNLLQYAAVTEQEIETTNESAVSVTAAVNGRKPRVAGHWKRVINAGYAASVLNREVQDELEQLVQELGYELVRVKGILDDDMCVFRRNMWGEIQFCWNYIDEVIDFILSTGAKPLLEFGHMPLLLAKTDPGRTLRPAPSSLPRDLAEWRMLIKNLMEHLKERYGINQMRRWIFNPWISGDAIMSDEGDAFFETWKASYDEMKRVSPDLVTCLSFGLGPEEHLKAFIETMKEKECVPENFCIPLVWHGALWRGRGENESDPEQRERQYDCEPRPGFSAEPRGEGKRSAAEGWAWCTAGSGG